VAAIIEKQIADLGSETEQALFQAPYIFDRFFT
jgi:hypothetical protein